jgi:hypothetical protein
LIRCIALIEIIYIREISPGQACGTFGTWCRIADGFWASDGVDDMPEGLVIALLVLFLVHFAVFLRLALRRASLYHGVLSALFAMLVVSFAIRLISPEWQIGPGLAHQWARYLAWALASVTVPWTVSRIVKRTRKDDDDQ